ncbi:hypothetical protein [Rothia dentocariosa]|jgi:hypothetical protein|uniref:Uncharacterized protein n=1 Tax=Rothia dentocariosa TaxID=2047 RepID=A0AAE5KNC4_9MICC|nr:hypothetical protein [Rothia dentocariosa]MCM3438302.1 hypothetical protein [Rothia dentocariosa]PAK85412.1 hypothetical protein B8W87_06945 [Rothia dentocariosa]VTY12492.1 Uncharacterised protein [Rothia dentocariosa]
MNKEVSFLEEISEQELDQLNGGADPIGKAAGALGETIIRSVMAINTPSGGSCSVQDIMNDYC